MNRIRIENSSNIAEIGYDLDTMTLEVKFKNGGIYRYWPITKGGYDSLMAAGSRGKYFSKNIRNNPNVNYKKIDEMQAEE